ncbi:MAG: hypothetical protein AAGD86_04155 [Pseudomonadota bacterium]
MHQTPNPRPSTPNPTSMPAATPPAPRIPLARRAPLLVALTALLGTGLSGCVTSRIEESREAVARVGAGESIVILVRRQSVQSETEEGFTDCVRASMERGGTVDLSLGGEAAFLDAVFPWFEPRLAPTSAEELPQLMELPGVRERIDESGVRYLVWVEGQTEITGGGGNISCSIGTGGAGCLGLQWWDNDSAYKASIWDLKFAESAGTISSEATGTSYLPAVVIPIPLIARTKAAACKGLAQQLEEFFQVDTG